jgi:hypothetical protein
MTQSTSTHKNNNFIVLTSALESPKNKKKEKKGKRSKKDADAPKKPMSAFFCYQGARR